MLSYFFPSRESSKEREFQVFIYESDYKELCAWVLKRESIETGGDLFGLWADKRTAVIQLVVGPGKQCRRTSVSFYQDVPYLERVGSYVTQHEGLCHIGEWHSHHRMGLPRPSGGDERTVWSNMPSYKLNRFVIFIANIHSARNSDNVNIGCFLFEIESENGKQLPVLQGKFNFLCGENPHALKREVLNTIVKDAEIRNREYDLKQLHIETNKNWRGQHSVSVHMIRRSVERKQERKEKSEASNKFNEREEENAGKRKQKNKDQDLTEKLSCIDLEGKDLNVSVTKKTKINCDEQDPSFGGPVLKNVDHDKIPALPTNTEKREPEVKGIASGTPPGGGDTAEQIGAATPGNESQTKPSSIKEEK